MTGETPVLRFLDRLHHDEGDQDADDGQAGGGVEGAPGLVLAQVAVF
jgi:hypothetical protein